MNRARLIVAVAAVALMAQPLTAFSACWQMTPPREECPGKCPMGHQPAPHHSKAVQAADTACCEITSSEPMPLAVAAAGPQAPAHGTLTPLARLPHVERPVAPSLPEASPPRRASSSLTTLYCTFLI